MKAKEFDVIAHLIDNGSCVDYSNYDVEDRDVTETARTMAKEIEAIILSALRKEEEVNVVISHIERRY